MLWVVLAILVLVIAFLIYAFPVIQVCGDSMYPTFNDGDIILGCRLLKDFKVGNVFIYTPPVGEKYVIKRLTQISSITGKLFFEGDNSDNSYDSRMYGYISRDKIVAQYLLTIHKKGVCDNGSK